MSQCGVLGSTFEHGLSLVVEDLDVLRMRVGARWRLFTQSL